MLKEVLTVSALIAVVLLVRAIFKNRVPKRMIYCAVAGRAAEIVLCRGRYFLCRFFRRRKWLRL